MISIICPVYNKLNYSKKCIESLLIAINKCTTGDEIEIIIIDDGSTDGTSVYIKEKYPQIKVLIGDGSLWWSGSMNLGAKDAIRRNAEYVILINNDNVFKDDYLDKLVRFAKGHGFKIVGSKIMNLHTHETWSYGGFLNTQTGEFGMYPKPKYQNVNFYNVDWLAGMGTLIHRSVFEKIGFWNQKDFPQYFGDSDFILRAKENGFEPYVYLDSILWNDITNTGESLHKGSFKKMLNSLFSIKSHYDILRSFKFLKAHHVPWKGIVQHFVFKHGKFIGGFFKHKIRKRKY